MILVVRANFLILRIPKPEFSIFSSRLDVFAFNFVRCYIHLGRFDVEEELLKASMGRQSY